MKSRIKSAVEFDLDARTSTDKFKYGSNTTYNTDISDIEVFLNLINYYSNTTVDSVR